MNLVARLVEFQDIQDRLGLSTVHLFDVRWYLDGRDGFESYRVKHIRSAIFLDVESHLTSKKETDSHLGRHPLADPDDFLNFLTSHGVEKDHQLVFYDDQANSISSRAWWMASALGFNAALLNGGINSATEPFIEVGGSPEIRPRQYRSSSDSMHWDPSLVIDEDQLKAALDGDDLILLDARSNDRYLGINETVDPRSGHIPGAKNIFWMLNIDEYGRFRTRNEISQNFRSIGIEPGSDSFIVSSCGSGITACHNIFSLLYAMGIRASLYPPSFSGWCSNSDNPIEN